MKPGKELNALVAKEVMGWTTREKYVHGPLMHGGSMMLLYKGDGIPREGKTWSVEGFSPSTDITAAWEVVEKDDGWGHDWRLERIMGSSKSWSCRARRVDDGKEFYAMAETAPHAICLAALQAVE